MRCTNLFEPWIREWVYGDWDSVSTHAVLYLSWELRMISRRYWSLLMDLDIAYRRDFGIMASIQGFQLYVDWFSARSTVEYYLCKFHLHRPQIWCAPQSCWQLRGVLFGFYDQIMIKNRPFIREANISYHYGLKRWMQHWQCGQSTYFKLAWITCTVRFMSESSVFRLE